MILVVGGTGLLGRELVGRLLAAGEHPRVMTRHPDRAVDLAESGVELVEGDLLDQASTEAALRGCTTVVAGAHGFDGPRGTTPASVDRDGNRRLVEIATAQRADVVMVSIVGAAPESELELLRMKALAERHLRERSSAWTIVRATAYAELWIRIMRQTAARSGRPVVLGRGQAMLNLVSVRDVAALVERVVNDTTTRGEILEVGGPDTLTMTRLAMMVQAADGGTGSPRHVPRVALRAAAHLGWLAPALSRRARMALWVDAADHPFEAGGARARFPDLPSTTVAELLHAVRA